MPVCLIEAPAGLSRESKKELIQRVLTTMEDAYQMDDDRVYINEYSLLDAGHTSHDLSDKNWKIQSEPARIVCSFIAPPGLNKDAKRKMFRNTTEIIAQVFKISDARDILVFLNEHPLENVATNGYIQVENPAFSSPATT